MMIFKNGWQNIIRRMKAMQIKQQKSLAHKTGPHNSLPNTNGFHENFNRPVGGGRKGFVFGSLRADPTAITTALSLGHI
jgi:hypothetical protein